jgi:hypothetical protein
MTKVAARKGHPNGKSHAGSHVATTFWVIATKTKTNSAIYFIDPLWLLFQIGARLAHLTNARYRLRSGRNESCDRAALAG